MPCFYPVSAFVGQDGQVRFHESERGGDARSVQLPCGRCIGCRLERSRQWAVRCLHEAQLWDSNLFVTLTYREDMLPDHGSLRYRDFQLFMKRLRKSGRRVRFFMCGEYGEEGRRPHFHACLFNCDFADKRLLRSGRNKLWESDELTRLWGHGLVTFGAVTFESAAYVARYCTKKVLGKDALAHYAVGVDADGVVISIEPEFAHMSLKPGIGAGWFERFGSDVFPADRVVVRGTEAKPPRYYDKLYRRRVGDSVYSELVAAREYRAYPSRKDGIPRRLRDREIVTEARYRLSRRSL